jgi:signal transduction histidine kinase
VVAIRGAPAGNGTAPGHDQIAIEVEVRDNGRGFDLATVTQGFGIGGMRERAERMGAALAIHSAPGAGTTIHMRGTIRRSTA